MSGLMDMNPEDIPPSKMLTFLGVSLVTGNPVIGGLVLGGLALAGKALSFTKRKFQERRANAERLRNQGNYLAERDAQRRHELELERLKNPPPLPHEEALQKVRRQFEQNLEVIEASPLRDNEKAVARDRVTQKFIEDLEKVL